MLIITLKFKIARKKKIVCQITLTPPGTNAFTEDYETQPVVIQHPWLQGSAAGGNCTKHFLHLHSSSQRWWWPIPHAAAMTTVTVVMIFG